MSKVTRRVIATNNEISLVNNLAILAKEWVSELRFTREIDTDLDLDEADKSVQPTIYKYYLPKRQVPESIESEVLDELPPGMPIEVLPEIREKRTVVEDETSEFPAIIIRPTTMSISVNGNFERNNRVGIEFHIFVSEHDKDERYENALLATRAVLMGLSNIESGIIDFAYKLDQDNLEANMYDDSQDPKAGWVITTFWQSSLPRGGVKDLNKIK